jgi:hypothetical protein
MSLGRGEKCTAALMGHFACMTNPRQVAPGSSGVAIKAASARG